MPTVISEFAVKLWKLLKMERKNTSTRWRKNIWEWTGTLSGSRVRSAFPTKSARITSSRWGDFCSDGHLLRLRAIALALRVLRLRAIALALRVLRLRAIALALRGPPLQWLQPTVL